MLELLSKESQLTCAVILWKHFWTALIDTGSEMSVLNSRELKRLGMDEDQLKPRKVEVYQADGS